MFQEADHHRQESGDQTNKLTGWKRGCLTILVPVLAFYFLYALLLFAPSIVNRVKWQMRGSDDYKDIFSRHGLLPREIQDGVAVTVKDGEIEQAWYIWSNIHINVSEILTIDEMFDSVYPCPLLFPLIVCSYEYDPYYGYPSRFKVNCPIPDACSTVTRIRSVEILFP